MLWEENPESLAQLIRLPGQQYDEETGLYYNRHRYYDALLGRYITQDPIDTVRFTGRMKATEDESIGQALKPKGCHHLIRSHPVINRGSCSDTGCMIKI
ncbi:core protein [Salmonella enterica subsp. salamae]|nr:core protein [Salmonella enterica subsp. salamae]